MTKNLEQKNHDNIISLKTYMDSRFDATEKATDLAANNLRTRLDSLNEWRLQNKDERANFVTKSDLRTVEERLNGELKLSMYGL